MKKIVFLLSLMFCATVAWAQNTIYDTVDVDGWKLRCRIDGTVASVVGYAQAGQGDLTIPAKVPYNSQDYPVTSIGASAFRGCNSHTSITIPGSVESIGEEAFFVSKFESVTFEGTSRLTSIGHNAFQCCWMLSITIPKSVTEIGWGAFSGCFQLATVTFETPSRLTRINDDTFSNCISLSSINIPNSVTYIGMNAFYMDPDPMHPSALESIVIPSSVTEIEDGAFEGRSNLKTVYNLSSLTLTTGSDDNGRVAKYADRVVVPITWGSGNNAIYQIPDTYTIVQNEPIAAASLLPESTISEHYNFIYKKDGSWTSKKIVLTDDTCRFNAPVGFTADSVTYTRTLTDGNRSTLCLPFTTTIPDDLEVYEFTGFDGNTIHFAAHTDSIEAYTPYLVGKNISKSTTDFTFTQTNAEFPATSTAMASAPVTDSNMTFQGVMQRTEMSNNGCWNYGYKDGYFVRSGGSAHVNPFRCYFTWNNAPQGAPASLGVDTDGGGVGIEEVEADAAQNGRIRYSNDVYDLMGRMVRKEASDLRGLPKGIYIWRGKKVMAF